MRQEQGQKRTKFIGSLKAARPTRKVTTGSLSGAIVTLIVAATTAGGVVISPIEAAALTTVVSAALSWFVPDSDKDTSTENEETP